MMNAQLNQLSAPAPPLALHDFVARSVNAEFSNVLTARAEAGLAKLIERVTDADLGERLVDLYLCWREVEYRDVEYDADEQILCCELRALPEDVRRHMSVAIVRLGVRAECLKSLR